MDQWATQWRLRAVQRLADEKVSYRGLAKRMGVDYSTVQRQLSGACVDRRESLWFVRQLSSVMGWSLLWLLFGDARDLSTGLSPVPWLDDAGIRCWLDPGRRTLAAEQVLGWFSALVLPVCGTRMFVWRLLSDELSDMGYPHGSWLYIDPDRPLLIPDRHCAEGVRLAPDSPSLALCRLLRTDGLLIQKLRQTAGEIWCLPGNYYYDPHRLADVQVLGPVVASLRMTDTGAAPMLNRSDGQGPQHDQTIPCANDTGA